MKKIIITFIFLVFSFFIFSTNVFVEWPCDMWESGDVKWTLTDCLWSTDLVWAWEDLALEDWFKEKIITWTQNIALYLGIAAVFAIVLSALMMTISAWDDEKVSKAKNVLKWAIFWLLWIILASTIITLVVKFIYDLS